MDRTLLTKLIAVEKDMATERGPFILFALLLRDEFVNVASTSSTGWMTKRWDIALSAPWLSRTKADYDYLVPKFQSRLSKDEMLGISRFVVLQPDSEIVNVFNELADVEHGSVELRDTGKFGSPEIEQIFVITSKRRATRSKKHRRDAAKLAKAK